ncbi:MAG: hypothetical protein QM528_08400 [Phycisphaerales bacterium]|nr:hypothetical protein [Phycisphaerales bacterium]
MIYKNKNFEDEIDKKIEAHIKILPKVLQYNNEDLIDSFCTKKQVSKKEAKRLFRETKKFIWLCKLSMIKNELLSKNKKIKIVIDNNLLIIDEMWHSFILFTKDYTNFCVNYFGHYIHHAPTTKKERLAFEKKMKKDPQGQLLEIKEKMMEQMEFIDSYLGHRTVNLWYRSLSSKYTETFIKEISK